MVAWMRSSAQKRRYMTVGTIRVIFIVTSICLEYVTENVTVFATVLMNGIATGTLITTGTSVTTVVRHILSYNICDTSTNCDHGDDESNCGNVTTCLQ